MNLFSVSRCLKNKQEEFEFYSAGITLYNIARHIAHIQCFKKIELYQPDELCDKHNIIYFNKAGLMAHSLLNIFYICTLHKFMEERGITDQSGKKEAVESMFDKIAWRYDFLNHFLSFNTDKYWRRKAVKIIAKAFSSPVILDLATGTCDLAIEAMKIPGSKVIGIDISANMLEIGQKKITRLGYDSRINILQADSEAIPFADDTFDAAMVAFGIRNFANPLKGLTEMRRVVKRNGLLVVLEFSKPQGFFFKHIYKFYFTRILPFFGRLFSRDTSAYTYLPDSVMKFPDNELFLKLMAEAGWESATQIKMTGGIASIYTGIKGQKQ